MKARGLYTEKFEILSLDKNQTSALEPSQAWHQSAYHEMADVPVIQQDALSRLQSNVAQLEDLQGRLRFVLKEVRYLLKAHV